MLTGCSRRDQIVNEVFTLIIYVQDLPNCYLTVRERQTKDLPLIILEQQVVWIVLNSQG